MSNIFLDNASRYAERGFHVFPCISGGKTPLTKSGFKDASVDPAQIAEWSEQYPDANIGIATGASNLIVLDVDTKEGKAGLESLKQLYSDSALATALKETKRVRTWSGGYHFYFRPRENVVLHNTASKLGKDLDIRGDGGYVIAPPSRGADGREYTWETPKAPILEIPLELVSKLEVKEWRPTFLNKDPVGEGSRNDFLMRQGASLRAKGFEQDEIYAALSAINQNRCNPPVDDDEVKQIAGSVSRYEPGDAIERIKASVQRNHEGGGDAKKGKKKLDLKSYTDIEKERLDWLWYGRIARGKFGLLVGLPGKTKSYLTCYIIAQVTNGRPLPDDYVNLNPEPKSVLLITYEDGQGDTIKPRLEKCGADMGRVYTIPMESDSFTKNDWGALELALQEHPDIGLVVIDPIQAIMAGENDNSETVVRDALNPAVRLGHKYGVSFLGVKHLNKDEGKSIDSRVGGSQAYTGLARTIMFAGHDNQKEFEKGVTYAAVMVTKGNIAGRVSPITYEVNDRGLIVLGTDDTVTTERLLPKPPDRKSRQ